MGLRRNQGYFLRKMDSGYISAKMASGSNQSRQEIALAIRVGVPHLARVAQGIRDYADSETGWRFLISPETHDLPPASLKSWRGDGVIAQCNTREEVQILADLECPG